MAYFSKYFDYFVNEINGKIRWGYFIFFVTTKCNESCKHCFYHEHLNQKDEMSLQEISNMVEKLGRVQVLLLSGGEPFLRKDLYEVIKLFITKAGVKVVSIPTNALLLERITAVTKRLASDYPEVVFSVNPSIDHLHKKNDEFRVKKGSFDKSIKTVEALTALRSEYSNIEVVINTVVSNDNWQEMDAIFAHFKQFSITYHNIELLRGEPKEKSLSLPPVDEIKRIHKKALESRRYYIGKYKNIGALNKLIERISVLGAVAYSQSLKEEFLETGSTSITCTAGRRAIVVEPTRDVRLCELRPTVGNLADYDYDLDKLLQNDAAVREREEVKNCSCTHICFLNSSIADDKKSLFKIPVNYFSSR